MATTRITTLIGWLVVFAVVLTGLVYWAGHRGQTQSASMGELHGPVDANEDGNPTANIDSPLTENTESNLTPPTTSEPPAVPSAQSSTTEDIAQSEEAAAALAAQWNIDAGYPSEADMDALSGLPIDELLALVEPDNKAAAYFAGLKLAAAGNEDEARSVLIGSVSDGSIAAARLLRDIYRGYYSLPADPAEAEAWDRVALAMGAQPTPIGRQLTIDESTTARYLFFVYWQEINTRYMQEHGSQLPINPFPKMGSE